MRNRAMLVLLALLSNYFIGCSSLPSSTKEMWSRSGYGAVKPRLRSRNKSRRKQKAEKIYIGAMMLPSGDYFQRGVVQLVVEEQDLIFDDPYLKSLR